MLNFNDLSDSLKKLVNTFAPVEAYTELATHPLATVREKIAANPDTPPSVLRALADDSEDSVRLALAKNPAAPDDVLDKLAHDHEPTIRIAVAKNPCTPPETLVYLVRDSDDDDDEIRQAVARSPKTPPYVLRALSTYLDLEQEEDKALALALAANPSTPPDALVDLAKLRDDEINFRVINNPSASLHIRCLAHAGYSPLEQEYIDLMAEIIKGVIPNDKLRLVLTALVDCNSYDASLFVATHPSTPPDLLATLVERANPPVLVWIAAHPNTPPDALKKLATDHDCDLEILWRVACHPNTPPDVLTVLAFHYSPLVRLAVAYNRSTPVDVLRKLADKRGFDYTHVGTVAWQTLNSLNAAPTT